MNPQEHLGAGPFRILRKIASGSSSTVYEAVNEDRQDRVALKVFLPQITENAEWIGRIHREAETLKNLRHPNIARLHGFWHLGDKAFLELELVEGRTLREAIEAIDDTLLEPRLWLLAQLARALGGVHEENVVHRDLKPENVLISDQGDVKLVDFGLAKSGQEHQTVTQAGSFVGSLAYMAPEVIRGEKATALSDLYSFGVIAWELVCAKHPFEQENAQGLVRAILEDSVADCRKINQRIPIEIAEMITCCLQKEPSRRPQSVWQIEAAIMNALLFSGLMNYAKASVRRGGEPNLSAALQIKHAKLKTAIESALNDEKQRKSALGLLNEFTLLFPNDPALATYLGSFGSTTQQMRSKAPAKWIIALAAVSTLAAGLAVAWIYVNPVPLANETSIEVNRPSTAASAVETKSVDVEPIRSERPEPKVIEPKTSVSKPAEPKASLQPPVVTPARPDRLPVKTTKLISKNQKSAVKPVANTQESVAPSPVVVVAPERGFLKLNVDPEVRVYIDGRRISKSQLARVPLEAGRHQLLLERDGYLPIEETILIPAGQTININARGSQ